VKCIICGNKGEGHHVLTQKAYPELREKKFNIMGLCRQHHSEWHNSTMMDMIGHYFAVKVWFQNNGWTYCDVKKKFVPPSYS